MKRIISIIIICFLFISCNNNNELNEYSSELGVMDNIESSDVNKSVDNDDQSIIVHIAGEVLRSGVYEMSIGDRIIDVVNNAGGFTVDADKDAVNLAEKIRDGMKIYIPKIGEKINTETNTDSSGDIIDINNASKDQLMKLPSVGDKTSDSIIKYREEKPFKDFKDLLNVPGIGKKRLESFKGLISIGGKIYE